MRTSQIRPSWIAIAILALVQPMNAALLSERELLVSSVALLVGGVLVLRGCSRAARLSGVVGLAVAAVVAPLLAWSAFFIPLCRKDHGRSRFVVAAGLFVLSAVSAAARVDASAALAHLATSPVGKLLEVLVLLQSSAISAVLPFAGPRAAVDQSVMPALGAALLGIVVPLMLGRVVGGIRRPSDVLHVFAGVGAIAAIVPTLAGVPNLGSAAVLTWTLIAAACFAVETIIRRVLLAPRRRAAIVTAAACLILVAASGVPRSAAAFRTIADDDAAWHALLAEDPTSPYRWEYSLWLRERGELARARGEATRYLRGFGVPPDRHLAYAIATLHEGRNDEAFDLLKRLGGEFQPTEPADVRAALDLYEFRGAWDLFFPLAEARVGAMPQIRLALVKAAKIAERKDTFCHHLDLLVREERPTLEALKLAYRDALGRQDIPTLDLVGERAVSLYPESPIGYAAHGKAAKIVRRDDDMIRWHEASLERDDQQSDLHWDLAIVYHGKSDGAPLAIRHYERVLGLVPALPSRATVETWLAQLRSPPPPPILKPSPAVTATTGMFATYENPTQPPYNGQGQTVMDPVYPVTGDVRIQKPDLSVPSVGFPFVFERCYRSGCLYDGPLGRSWDFNLNMRMLKHSSGTPITSYDGTNRSDAYAYDSGVSGWKMANGRYDVITYHTSPTRYERTELDGFKYIYGETSDDANKLRVTEWKDTNGNRMLFHYDATTAAGKLTLVEDTNSRSYRFLYDSQGRLTSLKDFGSPQREIRYVYHASNDTLDEVIELYGETSLDRKTKYTYQTISGQGNIAFVTTITDGKQNAAGTPKPFVRNYYAASGATPGDLIVQEYGANAEYAEDPPPTGQAFLLARTPSTNTALFTDRAGTVIKFYYDTSNLITKKEWQHGSPYPKSEFEYNADGNITRIKKNDQSRIEYVYDRANIVTARTTDSGGANALTSVFAYGALNRLTYALDSAGGVTMYTYDANGNLLTHATDPNTLNLRTIFHYDSSNKYVMDWVDDPRGLRTTFAYDTSFMLASATRDPGGLAITVSYLYDQFGNLTSTTDALGNTTTMTVNRLNQVTRVTAPSPLSYETEFFYDRSDNLTKTEVQNGTGQGSGDFVVDMEYDLLDNLTKKIADIDSTSSRATTEYFYDLDDKLTRVKAPMGNETKWVYNDLDLNTSVTVGFGATGAATYTYLYDGNFRLTKVQEPLGANHKTEYEYDHHDRTTKVKNALGHYVKSIFSLGYILQATESYNSSNALLAKSTFTYDTAARLTKTEVMAKDDGGTDIGDGWVTSTVVYDANSNVVTKKDENNNDTILVYDNADRVSVIEDDVGSKVSFVYDKNSNVLTKTDEDKQDGVGGFDTFRYRFEYDKLNRLTKSYDPGNFASTFTYDARNLVTAQDPLGNKRILKYDELNRNIELNVEYAGTSVNTTKWEYDKNGRLTKLIDPRSKNTTYAYDALDRLTTETYHDATARTFGYDVNSNIVSAVDQNATSTNYFYDQLNRLTHKTFDVTADHIKGETTQVDFTYDALNRLVTASDSDSDVAFTYNTIGLVESEQMEYGGVAAKTVYHDYDDQGRRTKCRYPGSTSTSGQLEYTYDTLNRLSKLDRRTGSSTVEPLATWTFKGPSRVIKKDYGNGTWCDVSYNTRSLVGSVIHKKPDGADVGTDPDKILECVYSYDDAGKVKSEALVHYKNDGTVRQDAGFAYHYDKANRLTKLYREVPASALSSDPPNTYSKKVEYTFDASSNRQTVATTPSGGSVSNDVYTTNDTNSYTAVNFAGTGVQYEFDAAGSRTYTNEGAKYWYYDYQNHVVEIRLDLEQEEFVAYDHDGLGRRFAKHYDHDGLRYEANKVFYYSGAALIQEYDIDENDNVDIEVEYFWGQHLAEPVHIRKYNINSAWTLTQAGYYHQNAQGSVYAISGTNSPVTLVENYRYTEYGGVTVYAGDAGSGSATPFGNKWAWHCRYYDFEITNVFSGLALYGDEPQATDPELGRAISRRWATGTVTRPESIARGVAAAGRIDATAGDSLPDRLASGATSAGYPGASGGGPKKPAPIIGAWTAIYKTVWRYWPTGSCCMPFPAHCEDDGGIEPNPGGGFWSKHSVLSHWRLGPVDINDTGGCVMPGMEGGFGERPDISFAMFEYVEDAVFQLIVLLSSGVGGTTQGHSFEASVYLFTRPIESVGFWTDLLTGFARATHGGLIVQFEDRYYQIEFSGQGSFEVNEYAGTFVLPDKWFATRVEPPNGMGGDEFAVRVMAAAEQLQGLGNRLKYDPVGFPEVAFENGRLVALEVNCHQAGLACIGIAVSSARGDQVAVAFYDAVSERWNPPGTECGMSWDPRFYDYSGRASSRGPAGRKRSW